MTRQSRSGLPSLSRRGFIGLAATSLPTLWIENRICWAGPAGREALPAAPARLSPFEREHTPLLRVPEFTPNKDKIPIVVEMTHPMTSDHFITSVEVVNASDSTPAKGKFLFTPANGSVYLAFQARMDPGSSEVLVTAECNRHGRWSSKQAIMVDEGGGCAGGGDPTTQRPRGDDVHPPMIRIAELVKDGRLRRGELIHAQVLLRHPNRRAPLPAAGKASSGLEPLYLETLEVYYGDERAGRFEMTAAMSDDPFITFGLVLRQQQPMRVVLVNNRGQRLEARQEIRFA